MRRSACPWAGATLLFTLILAGVLAATAVSTARAEEPAASDRAWTARQPGSRERFGAGADDHSTGGGGPSPSRESAPTLRHRIETWMLEGLDRSEAGDPEAALDAYGRGLEALLELGDDPVGVWLLESLIAAEELEAGRGEVAARALARAEEVLRRAWEGGEDLPLHILTVFGRHSDCPNGASWETIERLAPFFQGILVRYLRAVTLRSLGEVQQELGHLDAALSSFEEALAAAPPFGIDKEALAATIRSLRDSS